MKILAFAGSARRDSFNRKLVALAAEGVASQGVEVNIYEFGEYPIPLYDGDLEQAEGLPENAIRFKQALISHDGFLIASPEYNSAYSPLLKTAIDWASRAEQADEPPLAAFRGKTAALMATSPGGLGGLRGLAALRMLLANISVQVCTTQLAIPKAHEAFDEHGQLRDANSAESLSTLLRDFLDLSRRFVN